jgi:4-amino-4-deoxy-L-arabinose transferase-like glycosyltransferase
VREGLTRPLWLALVIAAFCVPLFVGLGRTDLENDEAIYSFAVDQMVANGDWLNPRSSPDADVVFLEKPPLKFWIVAAPIALGILPHDEYGLRFWDAGFSAVAFLYVFAIGRRLGGAVCGLTAVMVLFSYGPLLFEHGLRGNNMEAPLFLCYCGGMYHYMRWHGEEDARRRVRHVVALALYFFLGFMTKFVAALFLPVVFAVLTAAFPESRRRVVEDRRAWLGAAALVVLLVAPWFVYQAATSGSEVWAVMFATHVFARFTAALDPGHIQPWNYYVRIVWKELLHMGTAWLAVVGLALLVVRALRREFEAVAVLAWLAIPLVLMSLGRSKLHHYAYPLLPPVALAIGYGPGWLARAGRTHLDRLMESIHLRLIGVRAWGRIIGAALLVVSLAAAVLAFATLVTGMVILRVGSVEVLRNSHVARPLVVALVLATLSGHGAVAGRVILPAALLMLVLPMNAYEDAITRVAGQDHPLRSTRDCLVSVRQQRLSAGQPAPGIYAIDEKRWFLHNYYYYLHDVGGWERAATLDAAAVDAALFGPAPRPVLIPDDNYRTYKNERDGRVQETAALALRNALLLMPGPYGACGPSERRHGGDTAAGRP